jgi:DNA-binding IscR family transcriptional regulator
MLKISRSRHYFVPVVESTCEILELLQHSAAPLKSRQIAERTRVSHTTTYRILRTLVHRGYVQHDLSGGYALAARQGKTLLPDVVPTRTNQDLRSDKSPKDLTTAEIVTMLSAILQFLQD